ncbi:type II secretion system protein [Aeromicrobium camelliae]|uniref:Type II secretion system protein n=1 Tax=Aeromicrobium camelliae TaxID=1538144 RepID=A0A3N6WL50_9ACTN|nr:type II secretion system F family protein [Aeromicrobium camelliae]RQN08179.1 type II secretion system protein [Aeromicrobium camelliae]
MTVLAAVGVGLAVLAWKPSPGWVVATRLHRTVQLPRTRLAGGAIVALGPVAGAVAVSMRPALLLVAGVGTGVAVFALRRWRRARRRAAAARREAEVCELVLVLAAALRAGLPAPTALAQVAREFPMLLPVAHAARLGGDVPGALHHQSRGEGGSALARLSAAWKVAETSGAPLAAVLDRLTVTEREERDVRREVEAGVAPARATAVLMATLPVFGLLLGSGLGGDPVHLILDNLLVAGVVAVGVALACLGVWWIDRIADGAERGAA